MMKESVVGWFCKHGILSVVMFFGHAAIAQEAPPETSATSETIDFAEGITPTGTLVGGGNGAFYLATPFGKAFIVNPQLASDEELEALVQMNAQEQSSDVFWRLEGVLKVIGASAIPNNGSYARKFLDFAETLPPAQDLRFVKKPIPDSGIDGLMNPLPDEEDWENFGKFLAVFDTIQLAASFRMRMGDIAGARRLHDRTWLTLSAITAGQVKRSRDLLRASKTIASRLDRGYTLVGATDQAIVVREKIRELDRAAHEETPSEWTTDRTTESPIGAGVQGVDHVAGHKVASINQAAQSPLSPMLQLLIYHDQLIERAKLAAELGYDTDAMKMLEEGFRAGPDVYGIARHRSPSGDRPDYDTFKSNYSAGTILASAETDAWRGVDRTQPAQNGSSADVFLPLDTRLILELAYAHERLGDIEEAQTLLAYGQTLNAARPTVSLWDKVLQFQGYELAYRIAKRSGKLGKFKQAVVEKWASQELSKQSTFAFLEENRGREFEADIREAYLDKQMAEIALATNANPEKAVLFLKLAINRIDTLRNKLDALGPAAMGKFGDDWSPLYQQAQTILIGQGRFAEAETAGRVLKSFEQSLFVRGSVPKPDEKPLALTDQERGWLAERDAIITRAINTEKEIARTSYQAMGASAGEDGDEFGSRPEAGPSSQDPYREREAKTFVAHRKAVDETMAWLAERGSPAIGQSASASLAKGSPESPASKLGKGIARVQIAVHEQQLQIFLTTNKGVVHVPVEIERSKLNELVFGARQELERARDLKIANDAAHLAALKARFGTLYSLIVAPLAKELTQQRIGTVIFDVQGALRYVPMAALWDGERWLVQRFTIATAASASNGSETARTALNAGQGFGTSAALSGFSALPAVDEELESILTGADGRGDIAGSVSVNEGFTRAAFAESLGQMTPILHVASHFVIRPGSDAASFLLMGDGSRLYLSELHRAKEFNFSNVDLLTLSACETAFASGGSGVEFEGLGTVALGRGAKTVIASLWSVDDFGTRLLMEQFYKQLATGKTGRAAALREAQIALIKSPEDSNPFYWAPFIMMGAWN